MNTFEQLHELHACLVRAQRAETAAIRKLSEFTASGKRGGESFNLLLDAVQAARRRTVELYDEWDRHVRVLQAESSGLPATAEGAGLTE
jgi:hypothetical protein